MSHRLVWLDCLTVCCNLLAIQFIHSIVGLMTLARILGTTPHLSPLLRKARRLGYATPHDLHQLAVLRGCLHYRLPEDKSAAIEDCGRDRFSNEELAVALVSAASDGDAQHIRIAAQLLSAPCLRAALLVRLACMERCVPILRYIAESGLREDEVGTEFWKSLLQLLPSCQTLAEGRMPHPSRFMSHPGWTPASRPPRRSTWLRVHG